MNNVNITDQAFIRKITEIVQANMANEHFGVDELVHASGISRSVLHHRLLAISGKSTTQFIREARLQRAMEMLQQEVTTASEVAYKVGFASPTYFSTCFHEYFGYPPGEVLKNGKREPEENEDSPSPKLVAVEQNPITTSTKKADRKISVKKVFVYGSFSLLIIICLAWVLNITAFQNQNAQEFTRLKNSDKSIAVLPFKNLSEDDNYQYFAEGITESILDHLMYIEKLKVISLISVGLDNAGNQRALEIVKKMNAKYILSGSVQQYDEQFLIFVQLTDTKDNIQIWSDKMDGEMSNIFKIQDDIAKNIADELRVVLSIKELKQIEIIPTRNMEAYSNYLKGHYFLNKRRESDIDLTLDCFKKAIAADPDYAEAYSGMAEAYWQYTSYKWYPRPEGFIKAEEFALKAIGLDKNLAEAHAIMGCVFSSEWKWEESRKEFKLAIELNPNSATARQYYARLLRKINKENEARVQINLAEELNPTSPMIYLESAEIYLNEQQYDKALEECIKIIELDPHFYSVYYRIYDIYLMMGEELKAVESLQKALSLSPKEEKYVPVIKEVYDHDGMNGFLKWYLNYELNDIEYNSIGIAYDYVLLGENGKAMDYLEKSYQMRIPALPDLMLSCRFKSLINEPRFLAMLDSMGLSAYQK